jgi:hypothetical protein
MLTWVFGIFFLGALLVSAMRRPPLRSSPAGA